mmetsp:Transcript_73551/g.195997  ORF Transcript_73551/g.195997 Transcript_73551/m.195997 type:complete len:201 (+) Transcript_73551:462-1064(+)
MDLLQILQGPVQNLIHRLPIQQLKLALPWHPRAAVLRPLTPHHPLQHPKLTLPRPLLPENLVHPNSAPGGASHRAPLHRLPAVRDRRGTMLAHVPRLRIPGAAPSTRHRPRGEVARHAAGPEMVGRSCFPPLHTSRLPRVLVVFGFHGVRAGGCGAALFRGAPRVAPPLAQHGLVRRRPLHPRCCTVEIAEARCACHVAA